MQGAVLTVTKPERRRSRLLVLLMLPFVGMAWLVGWTLCFFGRKTEKPNEAKPKPSGSEVTIIAANAIEEEPPEVEALTE